jgi:hypothetical protein
VRVLKLVPMGSGASAPRLAVRRGSAPVRKRSISTQFVVTNLEPLSIAPDGSRNLPFSGILQWRVLKPERSMARLAHSAVIANNELAVAHLETSGE